MKKIKDLFEIIKISYFFSKKELFFSGLLYIVVGIVPSILLYISANIIENATNKIYINLIFFIFLFVTLGAIQDLLQSISFFVISTLQDKINIGFQDELNKIVSTYPNMEIMEKKEVIDKVILSQNLIKYIEQVVPSLFALFYGIIVIIPIIFMTIKINWVIPILLLIGLIPPIYAKSTTEIESWTANEKFSGTFNIIRIINRILTQPNFAKDIRLYKLQNILRNKWLNLYSKYITKIIKIRINSSFLLFVCSISSAILIGIAFYITINKFKIGKIEISSLVIFIGAVMQIKEGILTIIYNYSNVFKAILSFTPFRNLKENYFINSTKIYSENIEINYLLSLYNINFSYGEKNVIKSLYDITLNIKKNESIMLIGTNGSGKSTLIKLICGLYKPSSGKIIWTNAANNIKYNVIGVLQDFSKLPMNTYENLLSSSDDKIRNILSKVGLDKIITDYSIPISSEIENGFNLSDGQWQRLMIARALLNSDKANLLIFDEPTSYIDPLSEKHIMNLILENSKYKTTIIATHLMKIGKHVDRIIVLDNGRIVESGNFTQLMQLKNKFYSMFVNQNQI